MLWFGLSFAYGGAPARADSVSDNIVRQLERISDSLRELAHREVRVTCECKGGS